MRAKKVNESVRHGVFPGFIINLDDNTIFHTTLDSDLAVDEWCWHSYNKRDNTLRYAYEGMNQSYVKNIAEKALQKIKDGESIESVQQFLEDEY